MLKEEGRETNRKIVSGIMLTLLLISVLTFASNVQPVRSDWAWTGTVYIGADGSVDPSDAPISTVDNVTYTLTDNIVGNVPADSSAIIVERDNIVVDGAGYTVQGARAFGSKGITLSYRNNITIKNTQIKEFIDGIYLYQSSSNSIVGNNITNNSYYGIRPLYSSYNSIVGNNITNNGDAIWLYYSSNNNSISGNNITNNGGGIGLSSSSSNSIVGNNITNNGDSIMLSSSNNNSISGNNITANSWSSIVLWPYSSNNSIVGNNITNNGIGIWLSHSSSNSIVGNNITNNGRGVTLGSSSNNNSVSGNNIIANSRWGIALDSSSNNIFCHNNFIDNAQQVHIQTPGYANVWDDGYPYGGNYWSDYAGVDVKSSPNQDHLGSDGIGDTPRILDADNRDRYPLMKPYPWGPHDIGITSIATSKTIVGQGFSLNINITILNYGVETETFNVTAYANTTVINQTQITLTSRNSKIITFTWNTTGVSLGTYTISAYATPVLGETDTIDNTYTDGTVKIVKHPVAVFTYSPTTPLTGQSVTFDASLSTPDGGTIISYKWDFGDRHYASGKIVTYQYSSVGNFIVILNVTDSEGLWDIEQKQIQVAPSPPVGGKAVPINLPINKPEYPALWIWLSTLIPPLVATAVYVKKRKRNLK